MCRVKNSKEGYVELAPLHALLRPRARHRRAIGIAAPHPRRTIIKERLRARLAISPSTPQPSGQNKYLLMLLTPRKAARPCRPKTGRTMTSNVASAWARSLARTASTTVFRQFPERSGGPVAEVPGQGNSKDAPDQVDLRAPAHRFESASHLHRGAPCAACPASVPPLLTKFLPASPRDAQTARPNMSLNESVRNQEPVRSPLGKLGPQARSLLSTLRILVLSPFLLTILVRIPVRVLHVATGLPAHTLGRGQAAKGHGSVGQAPGTPRRGVPLRRVVALPGLVARGGQGRGGTA